MAEGSEQPMKKVKIWDLPTRVFHWVLVLTVSTAWFTGEFGPADMTWHFWLGYGVMTLMIFRWVYGFIGSQHSRFSDFVTGPGAMLAYAKTIMDKGAHYAKLGHNPVGGANVMVILVLLTVQTVTGLFADDDVINAGPFVPLIDSKTSDLLTWIHEVNSKLILAVVIAHVGAVMFYLHYKKDNLVRPMITGSKEVPAEDDSKGFTAHPAVGAALLVAATVTVWYIISLAPAPSLDSWN